MVRVWPVVEWKFGWRIWGVLWEVPGEWNMEKYVRLYGYYVSVREKRGDMCSMGCEMRGECI